MKIKNTHYNVNEVKAMGFEKFKAMQKHKMEPQEIEETYRKLGGEVSKKKVIEK